VLERLDREPAREQPQRPRVDVDRGDTAAHDQRFEVAANGLDFREFGHGAKGINARALAAARGSGDTAAVITHLQGRLARMDITGPVVEVDVAGVRYEVLVPLFLWPELQGIAGENELDAPPHDIGLHIHYSASANQPVPVLVGFLRRAERDFFRKFITVEGVGPAKAAKAMNVSVSTIARAIEQEDRAALTRLPGIGARGADKIIASLRGKVVAEASMHDGAIEKPVDTARLERDRVLADAIETIAALGFPRADARRWVEDAHTREPSLQSVEALTLAVLRGRDQG